MNKYIICARKTFLRVHHQLRLKYAIHKDAVRLYESMQNSATIRLSKYLDINYTDTIENTMLQYANSDLIVSAFT